MSEWQDISTAPKDGTEIIGAFFCDYGDGSTTAYGPWTIAFRGGKWQSSWDGSQVISYMSDFGIEYHEPDIEPTHWQPMPSRPTCP
jgi:hypothetical protein